MNRERLSPGSNQSDNEEGSQWTCVATAPDQLLAEMWQHALRLASIPSMLAPQDTMSFLGVAPTPVRVMVPAEMRARAEEVLGSLSEDGEPDPGSDKAL